MAEGRVSRGLLKIGDIALFTGIFNGTAGALLAGKF